RSVSAAFQEHLRLLGLHEFPCAAPGSGTSARRDPGSPQEPEESREERTELLRAPRSPWALPPGCSAEEQRLRLLAVRAPRLARGRSVFLFFRTLRLVDQGVDEVDEGLLRFEHLEELVLSANRIRAMASANLPRTLTVRREGAGGAGRAGRAARRAPGPQVLELCGNGVRDLRALCARPPPRLLHLGLGHNRLRGASHGAFLTPRFWPHLVSLDLSFNGLTELPGLLRRLGSLRALRVLVLQGNPLALPPAYRALVVDSLPALGVLDDVRIGPDEKHRCHGLATRPELLPRAARVAVSVGALRGLPEPHAPGADFPVVACSYYVTYEF
ncbi:LRC43 protein, partial [Nothoprocta ornata]|nr:LRC43 protein [Nothoprocta ornata]